MIFMKFSHEERCTVLHLPLILMEITLLLFPWTIDIYQLPRFKWVPLMLLNEAYYVMTRTGLKQIKSFP